MDARLERLKGYTPASFCLVVFEGIAVLVQLIDPQGGLLIRYQLDEDKKEIIGRSGYFIAVPVTAGTV